MANNRRKLAILADPTGGGGITRMLLRLLWGLTESSVGFDIDLVLGYAVDRPFLSQLPPTVRVVDLGVKTQRRTREALRLIPPLVRYLRREQPDVLMAHLAYVNFIAPLAAWLAGNRLRTMLVEHNPVMARSRFLQFWRRWWFPQAEAIVAVSRGMAQQLEAEFGLPPGRVRVIYNPVVEDEFCAQMRTKSPHSWLDDRQPPVILAVGRLTPQKDFTTLLRAFATVRSRCWVRLLILGEGECRSELERLAIDLGIDSDVALPGFVSDPFPYMARSSVFVLSSRWEGLPTVLIEALACGTQVVATDCPFGSAEILEGGRCGRLVPVGEAGAMAEAIAATLADPIPKAVLQARSRDFTRHRAVAAYLEWIG